MKSNSSAQPAKFSEQQQPLDFSGFSIDIGIGLSSTAQSGKLDEVVGDGVEALLGNPG